MSQQAKSFYSRSRGSTPRGAVSLPAVRTSSFRDRFPLRELNSFPQNSTRPEKTPVDKVYLPGIYLPDQTGTADEENNFEVDEMATDSPVSDEFMSEYCDHSPFQTPNSSHPHSQSFQHSRPRRFEYNHMDKSTYSHSESSGKSTAEDIVALLQGQQSVLEELRKGQEVLQAKTIDLEKKFTELEKQQVSVSPSSSSSDEKKSGKRNRIVTSDLSAKVTTLYSGLDVQYFRKLYRLMSQSNKNVFSRIVTEILQQPDCKYTEKVVKVAARRCFENQRRLFIEQQSGKEAFTEDQSKRRKYRSRRERKYKRRSSVVSNVEMEKYWKHLSIFYMTEESDDPDNPNGIVEHKIPWRSKRLDEFIKVLDERLDNSSQPNPGLVAKKVRKIGPLSSSLPPENPPVWAIHRDMSGTSSSSSGRESTHFENTRAGDDPETM